MQLISPSNPWKSSAESRRAEVIRLTSQSCHEWFDREGRWVHPVGVAADGEWINPPQPIPSTFTRLTFWLCMGLMNGSEADKNLGNAILNRAKFFPHIAPKNGEAVPQPFDIFVTNHSMQMLTLHGEKLDPAVREKLERWAETGLADYRGNRQADYQFHGFNDNMPAKATLGLVLGGEYFNHRQALEHGLWNLRQLRDLLTRRGLFSEYNSPTYTPFTIVNLTEIARHARHEEAKELAAQSVERLWADILGHFHAPTGMVGGPYSRAYHFDSTGHLTSLSFLLWLVRGEGVFPHPIEEFSLKPLRLLHPHGFCPEGLGRLAWISSCQLTPPHYLADWAERRTYPYTLKATAERGGGGECHAGEVYTTQYQEEDFSLGTAEGDTWSQMQSEVFYLTYRHKRPATRREDVRVAYTKYLINDEAPRDPDEALRTHGNVHTLQDGRTALVLARPSLNLAGIPLRRMKFSLLLPQHFGEIDYCEMVYGHIHIEDGTIRMAIRPLNSSVWGGDEPVRIEKNGPYLLLSFINYEGSERTFTREELGRTLNGFAFTIAPVEEESREDFRKRVSEAECVDYWHFAFRTVRYRLGKTLLEMNYAVESDHVRFACVNGKLLSRAPWQADGLPAEQLPFLSGSDSPNAVQVPYEHLRVSWKPDAPWVIHSNGSSRQGAFLGAGWGSPASSQREK